MDTRELIEKVKFGTWGIWFVRFVDLNRILNIYTLKIVWHKIAEGITTFVFFTLIFFYKSK